jgi:hypothetical protein
VRRLIASVTVSGVPSATENNTITTTFHHNVSSIFQSV